MKGNTPIARRLGGEMSLEYGAAATAVGKVLAGEAGVKSAIYGVETRNVRRVYAIVTETLRHAGALSAACDRVDALRAARESGGPRLRGSFTATYRCAACLPACLRGS